MIGLLLVASTANADDWREIATLDSNGGVVLLDFAAIAEVKGFRRTWLKAVYTSDQPIPVEHLGSVSKDARSYRSEINTEVLQLRRSIQRGAAVFLERRQ